MSSFKLLINSNSSDRLKKDYFLVEYAIKCKTISIDFLDLDIYNIFSVDQMIKFFNLDISNNKSKEKI